MAVFFDGKTFAENEMIIVLGVTLAGEKIPLGFVQAASENERVCRSFIDTLIQRGLRYQAGLLVLIDGSKGLFKAITKALRLRGHSALPGAQTGKCRRLPGPPGATAAAQAAENRLRSVHL